MSADDFYDRGLEPVTTGDGWAVFTGCEGDSPQFIAFFIWEADAKELAMHLADDVSDVGCELAIITDDMGIVAANDGDIKTHHDLRQRIINARAAGVST